MGDLRCVFWGILRPKLLVTEEMLEDVCFAESEFAFKEYFITPTIIYNALLALLLIFSIAVTVYYFQQLPSTRDEDSDSLAREAQEKKVDTERIIEYILLIYDYIQLISIPIFELSFFDDIDISEYTSYFGVFIARVLQILQYITLRFTSWVPIFLFVFFYLVTFVTNIIRIRDDRIKAPTSHSAVSKSLNNFLTELFLSTLYIPATQTFLQMMVCEYSCSYFRQAASFKPFQPMAQYHTYSCTSAGFIILFILAYIRILLYHPTTMRFIAFEVNQSEPVMRFHPKFQVVYFEIKFLLLFVQEVIRIPTVVLAANIVIFGSLFIAQIYLQPCLGFGLRVNNLQSAFFFVGFSNCIFSLLITSFPDSTDLISVIAVVVGICGFICVYFCNKFIAQKVSMPHFPLTALLQGFPVDIKLKAALSIIDKVEDPSQLLLTEAGKALATIARHDNNMFSEQDQIALSGIERMSTKMTCPPILIDSGVIPDLISKLLDRRLVNEIKEIETIIQIIGNVAQFDDIDKCKLDFNQLKRIMRLLIETCERMCKSQKLQNDNSDQSQVKLTRTVTKHD
ncbi:MAG: hypothetical protein EZS28_004981 [Streblomastix strix]|uniref:Uncharacterized protein n=1 Tax=Streblomastix strix TaxID=222440 RepID=A0A5J4WXA7_9EUKA|nr:MAG: hypothetical protein EZS28_004981 [Streblomastix strix]